MRRPGGTGILADTSARRVYTTTLDRSGLALGAGALAGGGVTMLLVAVASGPAPLDLLVGLLLGILITLMMATAVGGPLWIAAHASGRRGPGVAAATGALAGFAVFLGGQTYGFGMFTMPVTDAGTLAYRWISGIATSAILAAISAGIALLMWRVAYRRETERPRR